MPKLKTPEEMRKGRPPKWRVIFNLGRFGLMLGNNHQYPEMKHWLAFGWRNDSKAYSYYETVWMI